MTTIIRLTFFLLLLLSSSLTVFAAPFPKLERLPLSERWYGIYVDNERVGFCRQVISEQADGYVMDVSSSIRIKLMGFAKEAFIHEVYTVSKSLALRSFDVEQTINGVVSHVSGRAGDGVIRLKSESNGKSNDQSITKIKGTVYPGPALNMYPLMKDGASGKLYKILTFDPEELRVKEVKISVLGEEKTPDGKPALKLRNNLYPFVNNDIWVDRDGNTLFESIREGLVETRSEDPKALAAFIGSVALAKKDLIYDFSLVRVEPPIRDVKKLSGLALEISGWNDAIALLQDGGQSSSKAGDGRITIKTGSLAAAGDAGPPLPDERYLKPAEKIESDAPEIVAKAKEVAGAAGSRSEAAKALAAWTAEWLKDTIEDGGSARTSFTSRSGNCQTHTRLYTALARSVGIPTRFVSGLVYQDGKGFLYHSWAESLLEGKWVAVDPTYNQLPADPTHLKFFEGHTQEDMAPIIAIIGRIKLRVLDTRY